MPKNQVAPRRLVRVLAGQRAADALGPAGGARGVDHRRARASAGRGARRRGAERGQRHEAGHRAHGEPGLGIDPGPAAASAATSANRSWATNAAAPLSPRM